MGNERTGLGFDEGRRGVDSDLGKDNAGANANIDVNVNVKKDRTLTLPASTRSRPWMTETETRRMTAVDADTDAEEREEASASAVSAQLALREKEKVPSSSSVKLGTGSDLNIDSNTNINSNSNTLTNTNMNTVTNNPFRAPLPLSFPLPSTPPPTISIPGTPATVPLSQQQRTAGPSSSSTSHTHTQQKKPGNVLWTWSLPMPSSAFVAAIRGLRPGREGGDGVEGEGVGENEKEDAGVVGLDLEAQVGVGEKKKAKARVEGEKDDVEMDETAINGGLPFPVQTSKSKTKSKSARIVSPTANNDTSATQSQSQSQAQPTRTRPRSRTHALKVHWARFKTRLGTGSSAFSDSLLGGVAGGSGGGRFGFGSSQGNTNTNTGTTTNTNTGTGEESDVGVRGARRFAWGRNRRGGGGGGGRSTTATNTTTHPRPRPKPSKRQRTKPNTQNNRRHTRRRDPNNTSTDADADAEYTTDADGDGGPTTDLDLDTDGDPEVDQIVVDNVLGEKGSITQPSEPDANASGGTSGAVGSRNQSHSHTSTTNTGSGVKGGPNAHGSNSNSASATHTSGGYGFWESYMVLTVLRWRLWPAIYEFFKPGFVEDGKEAVYQKETWYTAKSLAIYASLFPILNWVLVCAFGVRPFTLADDVVYFGIGPVLCLPIPFFVIYDFPNERKWVYQVVLACNIWLWPFYQLGYIVGCGFYQPVSHCGTRDFLSLFYYTIGLPVIGLFGLRQTRLVNFGAALVWVVLSFILVVPLRHSWVRNAINTGVFHGFLLYIHYKREMTSRRLFSLRDQLKIQFRATQKAQINERKASDSKRRLTSYMFHEVRVPLNTALLAVQNLEATGIVPKDQRVEWAALGGSLSMMSKVLNDVLDFNRLDSGRFSTVNQPYNLHQAIESMLVPLRLAANARGLKLDVELDRNIDMVARKAIYTAQGKSEEWVVKELTTNLDERGVVVGDEMRLRQILSNLTSNACKFTPAGGSIKVVTKLLEFETRGPGSEPGQEQEISGPEILGPESTVTAPSTPGTQDGPGPVGGSLGSGLEGRGQRPDLRRVQTGRVRDRVVDVDDDDDVLVEGGGSGQSNDQTDTRPIAPPLHARDTDTTFIGSSSHSSPPPPPLPTPTDLALFDNDTVPQDVLRDLDRDPDPDTTLGLSRSRLSQHNSLNGQRQPPKHIVVRIEVHDTGVGIRAKDLVDKRLFSPYVQTEIGRYQGGKGTGLGLALVRRIVKLSGGRLGVKSKLGQGSEFWVELLLGVGEKVLEGQGKTSGLKSESEYSTEFRRELTWELGENLEKLAFEQSSAALEEGETPSTVVDGRSPGPEGTRSSSLARGLVDSAGHGHGGDPGAVDTGTGARIVVSGSPYREDSDDEGMDQTIPISTTADSALKSAMERSSLLTLKRMQDYQVLKDSSAFGNSRSGSGSGHSRSGSVNVGPPSTTTTSGNPLEGVTNAVAALASGLANAQQVAQGEFGASSSSSSASPPRLSPPPHRPGQEKLAPSQPRSIPKGLRVLVVDDDPLTRTLMARMLTRLECIVDTAENGRVALDKILGKSSVSQKIVNIGGVDELGPGPSGVNVQVTATATAVASSSPPGSAQNTGPKPTPTEEVDQGVVERQQLRQRGWMVETRYDIVFLDNQMPIMSGLDTVRALRKRGRKDLIVGVTGNALLSDQQEYLDVGVDQVLIKPVWQRSLQGMLLLAEERRSQRLAAASSGS